MTANQTYAPNLRFPEFVDPWKNATLGDLATFSKGKGISKSDIDPDGQTFCVRYGELYTSYDTIIDEPLSRTSVDVDALVLSEGGEVIVPASGETAEDIATAAVVVRPGVALGGDLNIIRSPIDGGFLASYLSGKKRMALASMAQGNSVVHLYPAQLSTLRLGLPTLPEQREIAGFLGAVDTKIAQLSEKKRLLEDYKKGCTQQLFAQKTRFKDYAGNSFPDWEEKRLGEVFSWINTNSLSRARLTYDGGHVQNIHYGDIHTKFAANFHQEAEPVPYVKDATSADFKPEQFCKVGDIVIADASEDYADIGKAIEIVSLSETPLVAGLHTYIARPNPGTVQTGFAGYLLRSAPMRRQIVRIAQGISVLGISKGNLEKLTFFLPHPEEQRKIANFLSALDYKISLVEQELTRSQAFKKGLLQQMFL